MFKKILIILFLFFSFTGISHAKALKFAQIADVHYKLDETSNSKQSLKWAIDELNKINDLDFVIFEFTKNNEIPKIADKIHVNMYTPLNPPNEYTRYVQKSYNQCGYV